LKCNLFLNGKAGETPLSLALLKWDFELADILLNKGVTELTRISFEIDEKNAEENLDSPLHFIAVGTVSLTFSCSMVQLNPPDLWSALPVEIQI